jgi:hypothetical protein
MDDHLPALHFHIARTFGADALVAWDRDGMQVDAAGS